MLEIREKLKLSAADAYGDINPELVVKVKKTQFPPDADLQVGDQFQVNNDAHSPVFTIMAVDTDEVTVDGNHPMAEKIFSLMLRLLVSVQRLKKK